MNVRGVRPDSVSYQGAAEPLRDVWIAVRASLRSVLEMVNGGGRTFVEVGPGKVLSGLIQRISNDVKAVNVQEFIGERLPLASAGARGSATTDEPIDTGRSQGKP